MQPARLMCTVNAVNGAMLRCWSQQLDIGQPACMENRSRCVSWKQNKFFFSFFLFFLQSVCSCRHCQCGRQLAQLKYFGSAPLCLFTVPQFINFYLSTARVFVSQTGDTYDAVHTRYLAALETWPNVFDESRKKKQSCVTAYMLHVKSLYTSSWGNQETRWHTLLWCERGNTSVFRLLEDRLSVFITPEIVQVQVHGNRR